MCEWFQASCENVFWGVFQLGYHDFIRRNYHLFKSCHLNCFLRQKQGSSFSFSLCFIMTVALLTERLRQNSLLLNVQLLFRETLRILVNFHRAPFGQATLSSVSNKIIPSFVVRVSSPYTTHGVPSRGPRGQGMASFFDQRVVSPCRQSDATSLFTTGWGSWRIVSKGSQGSPGPGLGNLVSSGWFSRWGLAHECRLTVDEDGCSPGACRVAWRGALGTVR